MQLTCLMTAVIFFFLEVHYIAKVQKVNFFMQLTLLLCAVEYFWKQKQSNEVHFEVCRRSLVLYVKCKIFMEAKTE